LAVFSVLKQNLHQFLPAAFRRIYITGYQLLYGIKVQFWQNGTVFEAIFGQKKNIFAEYAEKFVSLSVSLVCILWCKKLIYISIEQSKE